MKVLSRIVAIFFMQIVLFYMTIFVTRLLVNPFLDVVIGAADNLFLQYSVISLIFNVVSLAAATWFTLQIYAAGSAPKNFKNLLIYVEIPTVVLGLIITVVGLLVAMVIGPGAGQHRNDYVLLVTILLPAILFPLTAFSITKLFLRSRLGQSPNLGKK